MLSPLADPGREPPSIIGYARSTIVQAATTHLECHLVSSLKMGGGLKKTQFLSGAVLVFKGRVPDTSATDLVHQLLAPLMKHATSVPATAAKRK